ncbi:Leucine-rich repeat receptor-like protein kinase TDR [Hibiscus syriacus]|uniref:non-specific serine/threonine protein kinase n=1 Tax=Hibiscus syriacus TaxID=106335 RepID=A0A6A2XXL9_HIBSY|nr:Leucine-rich repeat receptor-like protein kinase TDR [Hibiscus syriacus]
MYTREVEAGDNKQPKRTAGAIVWIVAAALCISLFVLVEVTRCLHCSHRFIDDREIGRWKLTAFQQLNFTADDVLEYLSMTDEIIGIGSTGTVYKAEMPDGEIIAVKKLWGKQKDTARRRRGPLPEVEVLGNVRHRNIVRLLGCCSNRECTMLVYEYMPNGNLDDLLHGNINRGDNLDVDWVTRHKIALGMEVRVADFRVAKLIQGDDYESMSMSVIGGSYGYIAPEYAYTLQVDEKSDVYSFGVVLMEIVSGKRSADSEFGDGNSIVERMREEMMQMLRIALLCTGHNPADRPSMRGIVSMLQEAEPKRKPPQKSGS